jgi:uncharacterized protein (TIGR02266 family)
VSDFSPPRRDKRQDLRVPVRVEVEHPGGGRAAEYALDLSASGLCLQTRSAVSPGDRLRLRFRLPGTGPAIAAEAEVLWATGAAGSAPGQRFCEAGLRFVSIGAASVAAIEAFVVEAAHGAAPDA